MKKIIIHRISIILILGFLIYSREFLNAQVKYKIPCNSNLLEVSLDTAIAQVGTLELTGHNDGDVEKYHYAAGLKKGSAYCAAGQYYCFLHAANALKLSEKEIPILKTGVANYMFNDVVKKGSRTRYLPSKHDLIVWRIGSSWSGHIERIIDAGKAGWVKTIGFNTTSSQKGQQNKNGVFYKRRNIYYPMGRLTVRGLIGFIAN